MADKNNSPSQDKLFKELLEKVAERQARLDKEAKEKIAEKEENDKYNKVFMLLITKNQSLIKEHKRILPSPKDNEEKYYQHLLNECENFLRIDVKNEIEDSLKLGRDFFNVCNEKKCLVSYAVSALTNLGYKVEENIVKASWCNPTRGLFHTKNGYIVKMKLF